MSVARIGDELEAAFHRIAAAEMHRLRLEQQLQVAADLFMFLVRDRQHNDPAFRLSLCVPWILSLPYVPVESWPPYTGTPNSCCHARETKRWVEFVHCCHNLTAISGGGQSAVCCGSTGVRRGGKCALSFHWCKG